jgi:hypothetical protein
MVVVALGLPGVPVVCWALAIDEFSKITNTNNQQKNLGLAFFIIKNFSLNIVDSVRKMKV